MPGPAFLQNIGSLEWVLIVLVILLVFGASRIPRIARALGRSTGEFKKGLREGDEEHKENAGDDDASGEA